MAIGDRADYEWLIGGDGGSWLARLADDKRSDERLAVVLRQELSLARTHLLLEQRELRRRARVKFTRADRMFFTRQALEQATDERVADYKAARIASGTPVVDLCSGIGGDALALAARGPVLAVERDPMIALLALANGRALERSSLTVLVGDAEQVGPTAQWPHWDVANGTAWHLDPDRRPTGRRTTSLDACRPGGDTVRAWRRWSGDGATKLAPATDVPADLAAGSQREWLESRGECRQQVLWFGGLARHAGRRSATIVDAPRRPRTVVESPDADMAVAVAGRPARYVAEPRPAVAAAGLVASLAVECRAAYLGPPGGYLTSDQPVADEAWRQFELQDVMPLDRRRLRAALKARRWGQVVWKCRGADVALPRLVQEAGPREGDATGVVLVTRFADRVWALLAVPVPPP